MTNEIIEKTWGTLRELPAKDAQQIMNFVFGNMERLHRHGIEEKDEAKRKSAEEFFRFVKRGIQHHEKGLLFHS